MASAVFVSGCDALLGIGNPDIVDGSADAAARPKDAASDSTVVVSRDAPKEIGLTSDGSGSNRDTGSGTGSGSSSRSGSASSGTGASDGGTTSTSTFSGSTTGTSSASSSVSMPPPSCDKGGADTTKCGATNQSCCTSPEVAGGTYDRTYTNTGGGATGEADPSSVTGFRLDQYDVTVGRFRQFVNAWSNGYMPAAGAGKHTHLNAGKGLLAVGADAGIAYEPGWATSDFANIAPTDNNLACDPQYASWTPSAGPKESLPINCVNWAESYAFCIWDGGFLPSEAELEFALAGGSQQLEYPWGAATPGTTNEYAIYSGYYVGCIAPVGMASLGAGVWGQLDLVGNVYQWALDYYATPYVDPCVDCAYLAPSTFRVLRGAYCFDQTGSDLNPAVRGNAYPANRNYGGGFRCARTP